ncbi:hypothetical protein N7452_007437 [Penicillium brevicompactum]|uniref:Myb-like domain-containing protein n=1 Tax=Penicillium brevicompactum TaxID=5074 RepID=A0A9W9QF99_PENBR|nr:hypothetical protein N7452_007437 [Penicillium brevicompactum]
MPGAWDQQREQELLLAIDATHTIDWAAVSKELGDTSINALRKHINVVKQLQKNADDAKPAAATKASTASTAKKPAKRAAKPPASKAAESTAEDTDSE